MRAFFGGQIKEDCRGNLAAVVSRSSSNDRFETFLYPVNSDEFIQLTGVRAVSHPPFRVYMGISLEVGEKIIRGISDKSYTLKSLDELVVLPYFIDKNLEKPPVIILNSTPNGYEVVNNQ